MPEAEHRPPQMACHFRGTVGLVKAIDETGLCLVLAEIAPPGSQAKQRTAGAFVRGGAAWAAVMRQEMAA